MVVLGFGSVLRRQLGLVFVNWRGSSYLRVSNEKSEVLLFSKALASCLGTEELTRVIG